jgi:hypothetical protein
MDYRPLAPSLKPRFSSFLLSPHFFRSGSCSLGLARPLFSLISLSSPSLSCSLIHLGPSPSYPLLSQPLPPQLRWIIPGSHALSHIGCRRIWAVHRSTRAIVAALYTPRRGKLTSMKRDAGAGVVAQLIASLRPGGLRQTDKQPREPDRAPESVRWMAGRLRDIVPS